MGKWSVQATVPGGGTYEGIVEVSPAGETLEFAWDTSAGSYVGIGLAEGEAWYVACGEDADRLGLALVTWAGRLRWSPATDPGTVGTGTLAPAFAGRDAPAWTVGPDSTAGLPFASVVLAGDGEVREAALTGGRVERGLALATPAGWAIAWYPRFDQTVILRYRPGRRRVGWEAVWALGGRPGTATELLRPAG